MFAQFAVVLNVCPQMGRPSRLRHSRRPEPFNNFVTTGMTRIG